MLTPEQIARVQYITGAASEDVGLKDRHGLDLNPFVNGTDRDHWNAGWFCSDADNMEIGSRRWECWLRGRIANIMAAPKTRIQHMDGLEASWLHMQFALSIARNKAESDVRAYRRRGSEPCPFKNAYSRKRWAQGFRGEGREHQYVGSTDWQQWMRGILAAEMIHDQQIEDPVMTEPKHEIVDRWIPETSADGTTFCSPACGMGCSTDDHRAAHVDGQALATKMGPGWEPRVWENCGWNYSVKSGPVEIYPGIRRWERRTTHEEGVDKYRCYVSSEPQVVTAHVDPRQAVVEALLAVEDQVGRQQAVAYALRNSLQ